MANITRRNKLTSPVNPGSGPVAAESAAVSDAEDGSDAERCRVKRKAELSQKYSSEKEQNGLSPMYVKGLVLLSLLAVVVGLIAYLIQQVPDVPSASCRHVSPRHLAHLLAPQAVGGQSDIATAVKIVGECAAALQKVAPGYTVTLLASVYIGLQAFAIPGPLILSIVAGAMYGRWWSQLFVALCATLGATMCYGLSHFLARPFIQRFARQHVEGLQQRIQSHSGNLFWYMLFLRITPACPNWVVNLASPLVGVPISTFVAATAIGLVPANFFHTQTGATLAEMGQNDSFSLQDNKTAMLTLFGLQFAALLPTIIQKLCGSREKKVATP